MAATLGETTDAAHYTSLAAEAKAAFIGAYVGDDGRMTSDAQTAYALALEFDLLPDELRAPAAARLAALVRAGGNRIGTGFVGTPLVTDALSANGQLDAAYDLLLEKECPSWLYQVGMGATTVWERWDSMRPDGSVNPGSMTSFNHYALGAVVDWMHRVVAGLAADAPGYRRIRVAPRPGGGLSSASARHRTPFGEAAVSWRIDAGVLHVTAELPVGTTGVLALPGQPEEEVGHGTHTRSVTVDRVDADATDSAAEVTA
jgi:alpha-L-rhamnosidase